MENLTIANMADVRSFFYFLIVEMGIGASFHPDTPIDEYVDDTGYEMFQRGGGKLQKQLEQCFVVCNERGQDIYEQGMDIVYAFGYLPRPEQDGE